MFKISESKNSIAKFLRSKILENFKLESELIKRAEKFDQSDLILAKMKSGKNWTWRERIGIGMGKSAA